MMLLSSNLYIGHHQTICIFTIFIIFNLFFYFCYQQSKDSLISKPILVMKIPFIMVLLNATNVNYGGLSLSSKLEYDRYNITVRI